MDVLDGLGSLVDKSLLRQEEAGGEPRFGMLETIRAYALERLEASGEAEALRRRHAACCLALAEPAFSELRGPRQAEWAARLEREHNNARAALGWALAADEHALALRLAAVQAWFWQLRGHLAGVAGARGQPERAARLLGAAEALRDAAGVTLDAADRAVHDRAAGAARTALGDAAFSSAWAEGRAMPLEQAVADALETVASG